MPLLPDRHPNHNPSPNPYLNPDLNLIPTLNPNPTQVCLFCLTDNIFRDTRSVMLIARAVKLGKQCELIVMPKAKWGPERDRPFPENVFNPTWTPFLPELSGAFTTIAITWELEYKPACVLQVSESVRSK